MAASFLTNPGINDAKSIGSSGYRWMVLLVLLSTVGIFNFATNNTSLCLANGIIGGRKTTWETSVLTVSKSLTNAGSRIRYGTMLPYEPSKVEAYIIANSKKTLKYAGANRERMAQGCQIWKDPKLSPYYENLQDYRAELKEYNTLLNNFKGAVTDLREHMTDDDKSICDTLELHPDGLQGIFSKSQALSQLPGGAGYMEPLTTPFRHPDFCFANRTSIANQTRISLMDMGYLIHDFAALCRNRLHPTSRTVFIDMGAALDFHHKGGTVTPAIYVTHMYQKFGFHFDHIYAYEIKEKDPADVYKRIPDDLKAAYHWYNVGVASDPDSPNNPLRMVLNTLRETDFVVVKLDIDTSFIENPLARWVLQDERFHNLIDAFYFEHHVFMAEMAPFWKTTMVGSVDESLKLFHGMRKKGIPSHYWP